MQTKSIYLAVAALTIYCGCQNANARGYVSSQNQNPSAVVVEEIQETENTADSAPASGAWDKTKEVSSDVWDGTKEVTSDVWDGTKKVSSDVWDGAKEVGGDIKEAVSDE